jgi:hypothetical protein
MNKKLKRKRGGLNYQIRVDGDTLQVLRFLAHDLEYPSIRALLERICKEYFIANTIREEENILHPINPRTNPFGSPLPTSMLIQYCSTTRKR